MLIKWRISFLLIFIDDASNIKCFPHQCKYWLMVPSQVLRLRTYLTILQRNVKYLNLKFPLVRFHSCNQNNIEPKSNKITVEHRE
ncbi:hypothetical protein SAMN05660330_03936 [Desulforhopalus singaporensis]|uniref:Uncharacterized protein n=1 Tax=Desulforhopalus singaporensis TaxID=91360 RepID=A0A1H0V8Y7_9BACT|nr:hypothetical protein SAMN05660330_03936 [Desulforhopalus singaporensis]